MRNTAIKCSVCKKRLFYLPDGYTMDLKVKCVECHKGLPKKKKEKQTLSASYAKMKKGIRPEVHSAYSFRSATEANFARVLNYLGLEWKFEERVFTFGDHYKTAPHIYIMDFEITKGNAEFPAGFYEIKGYMTGDARKKLRRVKKLYPEEFKVTTVVVYNKYKKKDIEFCNKTGFNCMFYDEITKKYSSLVNRWE